MIIKKRGFTLPEMLTVVLILVILVTIAVPLYRRSVDRSKVSDAMHVLDTVSAKQESVWVETGSYASNFQELGAPVKGLTGTGTPVVGNYTYSLQDYCVVADKGDYRLIKNYATQDTGCIGDGCKDLQGIVPTNQVICTYSGEETSGSDSDPDPQKPYSDSCTGSPSSENCCSSGFFWTGEECVTTSCSAGKAFDTSLKSCTCNNSDKTCPNENYSFSEALCTCQCNLQCPGAQIINSDCTACTCPSGTNWKSDTEECIACSSPKTRWTGVTCACPESLPIYVSATETSAAACISNCPSPLVYSNSKCSCPSSYSGAIQLCANSGGSWGAVDCQCYCNSPRTELSGDVCICPAPKSWNGTSCSCPASTPNYNSATNTCEKPCSYPHEWISDRNECGCPAAYSEKITSCTESGGSWNSTLCTCACNAPRSLLSGEVCSCPSPRTEFMDGTCYCPSTLPNYNQSNNTCNPACELRGGSQTVWNGAQCMCPQDSTEQNACSASGGTWSEDDCSCHCGTVRTLLSGKSCICDPTKHLSDNSNWPVLSNFDGQACCVAAKNNACGTGVSYSTSGTTQCGGSCSCPAGNTLRGTVQTTAVFNPGYCCKGTCSNGAWSTVAGETCKCICNVGYKLNESTGICESCGTTSNFTWTDNQCNFTCNSNYCRQSNVCVLVSSLAGYKRNDGADKNTNDNCVECPATGTHFIWVTPSCTGLCNEGYCIAQGQTNYYCSSTQTGQYTNSNLCANCTNAASNCIYTSAGGRQSDCHWSADTGDCYNGTACVGIPLGNWTDEETEHRDCKGCLKPNYSTLIGSGTTGPRSCPWDCNENHCKQEGEWTEDRDNACPFTTEELFRDTNGLCAPCATSSKCWDRPRFTCNSTSNTLFRKAGGLCEACEGVTNCWNTSTLECVGTSFTLFKQISSGVCITCSDSNKCWDSSSDNCVATTSTKFRGSNGRCVACTSSTGCWNGIECLSQPSGQYRVTATGLCTPCTNAEGCNYTSYGDTDNSCESSIPSTKCREADNTCVLSESYSNYIIKKNPNGDCVANPSPQCYCNNSSGCGTVSAYTSGSPIGYYRATDGSCTACSNAGGCTYTSYGGLTNTCTSSIPSGTCRNTSTNACLATSATNFKHTTTGACISNPSPQCFLNNASVSPVGYYRATNGACSSCTNASNCTYTGYGGTSNACASSVPTGTCRNTSTNACTTTSPTLFRNTSTAACVSNPSPQCFMNNASGSPAGYYRGTDGTCSSCANAAGCTYGYGGTLSACPSTIPSDKCREGDNTCVASEVSPSYDPKKNPSGFCVDNPTPQCYCNIASGCGTVEAYTSGSPVGYYRGANGNCTACSNAGGCTYTGYGGTSNTCASLVPSGTCRNTSTNACAATSATLFRNTSTDACVSNPSPQCFMNNESVSPTGYYRATDGTCATCTNASGCTYTGYGGTSNACASSLPTGTCRNTSTNACLATSATNFKHTTTGACISNPSPQCFLNNASVSPTGYYRIADGTCSACTNASNCTYTGYGGTTNACASSVPTGTCRNTSTNACTTTSATLFRHTTTAACVANPSPQCFLNNASSSPDGYYRATNGTCATCTNAAGCTYGYGGTTSECPSAIPSDKCREGDNTCVASEVSPGYDPKKNPSGFCIDNPSPQCYCNSSSGCGTVSAYTSGSPVGYYRGANGNCTACSNASGCTYTSYGGTSNSCESSLPTGTCRNTSTNACAATSATLFRNTTTGACISNPSPQCFLNNASVSPTGYYRAADGTCATCTNASGCTYSGYGGTSNACASSVPTGTCRNTSTNACTTTSATLFRNTSTDACVSNPSPQCFLNNASGSPVGYYRATDGTCSSCTNAASCTYTGYGGTSNACASSVPTGTCRNTSTNACTTTSATLFRNTSTDACVDNPSPQCFLNNASGSPVGYYRATDGTCSSCTNAASCTYTGYGGTTNSCASSVPTGTCRNTSTNACTTISATLFRNTSTAECVANPSPQCFLNNVSGSPDGYYRATNGACAACANASGCTYGYGGTSSACPSTIPSDKCREGDNTCVASEVSPAYDPKKNPSGLCIDNPSPQCYCNIASGCGTVSAYTSGSPVGYYRGASGNCTACSNAGGCTYTGYGGTANACASSIPTGTCRNTSTNACTATSATLFRNTSTGACVANASPQCFLNNVSGSPVGYYRATDGTCSSCTNASGCTYSGYGGTSNACASSVPTGTCRNTTTNACTATSATLFRNTSTDACVDNPSPQCFLSNASSSPNGYYRATDGTCAACANAAGCTYGYGGTSSACPSTIPSDKCREGDNTCVASEVSPAYDPKKNPSGLCIDNPSPQCYCNSSGGCGTLSAYTSGSPVGYYRGANGNCTACSNAGGCTYTGYGGATNACASSVPAGTCRNASNACVATSVTNFRNTSTGECVSNPSPQCFMNNASSSPNGYYRAADGTCAACTNAGGCTYTGYGGTANACVSSVPTGTCRNSSNACVATSTTNFRNGSTAECVYNPSPQCFCNSSGACGTLAAYTSGSPAGYYRASSGACTSCTNASGCTYTAYGGTTNTCTSSVPSGTCRNTSTNVCEATSATKFRNGSTDACVANASPQCFCNSASACGTLSAYTSGSPIGYYRASSGACTSCTNANNCTYTTYGGTTNTCTSSIPTGTCRNTSTNACEVTSATNFKNTSSGACIANPSPQCFLSNASVSPAGYYRATNGTCAACANAAGCTYGYGGTSSACPSTIPSNKCREGDNTCVASEVSPAYDPKKNPSGLCIDNPSPQCYCNSSGGCGTLSAYTSGSPVGYYRGANGNCTACSNAGGCTYTGYGGATNACASSVPSGLCRNASNACVATSITLWRNSSDNCVTCGNGACWNGSSCTDPLGSSKCRISDTGRCGDVSSTNFQAEDGTCTGCGTGNTCWSGTACIDPMDSSTCRNDGTNTCGTVSLPSIFKQNSADWLCVTCSAANQCFDGYSCVGTSNDVFRDPSTGSCVTDCNQDSKCWNVETGSCVTSSSTQCRISGTGFCATTSKTLWKMPSGLCDESCGVNDRCWNSGVPECQDTSYTQCRSGGNGICYVSDNDYRYTTVSGLCTACTTGTCWNSTSKACVPITTSLFRVDDTHTNCITCGTGSCWTGSACNGSMSATTCRVAETGLCSATSSTLFKGTNGNCTQCEGNACWNGSACVSPVGFYKASNGLCTACTNVSSCSFTAYGGTTNTCAYTIPTGTCLNGSNVCTTTSATLFRNTSSGACVSNPSPQCFCNSASACGTLAAYASGSPVGYYRATDGSCSTCTNASSCTYTGYGGTTNTCASSVPTGTCRNTSTNACEATSTTKFRNGSTGACVANASPQCFCNSASACGTLAGYTSGSPVGYYRASSGACASCTNASGCTYTTYGGTTNTCTSSIPTNTCRNTTTNACTATSATLFRNTSSGACISNPSPQCFLNNASVSPVGYFRNTNGTCTTCTNASGCTYTDYGGTSDACSSSIPTGTCRNTSTNACVATSATNFRNTETGACIANPDTQCLLNNVSSSPNGYYRTTDGTCSACTNAAGCTYGYGGTSSDCPSTIPSDKCREGDNTCVASDASPDYDPRKNPSGLCIDNPSPQCYCNSSSGCGTLAAYTSGSPVGYYRGTSGNCTACSNASGCAYTSYGGATNSCTSSIPAGTCRNTSTNACEATSTTKFRNGSTGACVANASPQCFCNGASACGTLAAYTSGSPVGYYRATSGACASCTNAASCTYTGYGGTSNACASSVPTGTCRNGSNACVATSATLFRNTSTAACVSNPSPQCFQSNTSSSPNGYYRATDGTCASCTNASGCTYTGYGGTTNTCTSSIPTGTCRNDSNACVATSVTLFRNTSTGVCVANPSPQCFLSNTSSSPDGYYRATDGTCSACANAAGCTYGYGGTSSACPSTIPSDKCREGDNTCVASEVSPDYDPKKNPSGLCIDNPSPQCYCNIASGCGTLAAYTSGSPVGYYRGADGSCTSCTNAGGCTYTGYGGTSDACASSVPTGTCRNTSTNACEATSATKFRDGSTGACVANASPQCFCNSASACGTLAAYTSGSPVGYYRATDGSCTSCSNASGCTYTNYGGTSNACTSSIPTGTCRNTSTNACTATSATLFRNTSSGACISNPSPQCFQSNASVSPTGYYRATDGTCTACTNASGCTYSGYGGATNSCASTVPTSTCRNTTTNACEATSATKFRNGSTDACVANASPQCFCNGASACGTLAAYTSGSPVGYYRATSGACTSCTNASGCTYTNYGGTSNACTSSIPTGTCRNTSTNACTATSATLFRNTSSGACISNPSPQCFQSNASVSPTGYYRATDGTCTACTNASGCTYSGYGGTSNACASTVPTGTCRNTSTNACVATSTTNFRNTSTDTCISNPSPQCFKDNISSSPAGYYRATDGTCSACTNASGCTYSGYGGTTNTCASTVPTGTCRNTSTNACEATSATKFRDGSTGACVANASPQCFCNSASACGTLAAYTSGSPVGYYRATDGSCSSCTNASGCTYTNYGGTANACASSVPTGTCRNGSNACVATSATLFRNTSTAACISNPSPQCFQSNASVSPTGYYRATNGTCATCTNAASCTYTGYGGTSNACASSVPTGTCRNGSNACVATSATLFRNTSTAACISNPSPQCFMSNTSSSPNGYYRATNGTCAACTNASGCTYSGYGGTSNACASSVPTGTCRNGSNACVATSATLFRNGSTDACVANASPQCFCNGASVCGTLAAYTSGSPVGYYRATSGACASCTNASGCTYTNYGGTSNACTSSIPTSTCRNTSTNACEATSATKFRDGSTGACVSNPTSQCFCNSASACGTLAAYTSGSPVGYYRASSGACASCTNASGCTYTTYGGTTNTCTSSVPTGTCRNTSTNACTATSATLFRNTSTAACVSNPSPQCFQSNASVSPTGYYRATNGTCAACTNASGCTYTNYGGTTNACASSVPTGTCRNGSNACVATSATLFRNTSTAACVSNPSPQCFLTNVSASPVGYYRAANGTCSSCSNMSCSGGSYTGYGGTTNTCGWSAPSGYCAWDSSCYSLSTYPQSTRGDGTICVCNTGYDGEPYCQQCTDGGKCLSGSTCVTIPNGYYRSTGAAPMYANTCGACTNIGSITNASYLSGGGSSSTGCAFGCNSGYCYKNVSGVDGCYALSNGVYRNTANSTSHYPCADCQNGNISNTVWTSAGTDSVSGCTWACASGYTYVATDAKGNPTGCCLNSTKTVYETFGYKVGNACSSGGNWSYGSLICNSGFTGTDCTKCITGCRDNTTCRSPVTGEYTNSTTTVCTACTTKPSNAHYTGTTSSCPWACDSGYTLNSGGTGCCANSAQVLSDRTGCSSHGTRTRTASSCSGTTWQYTTWSSCTCDANYFGSTCSVYCPSASGCYNGSACVTPQGYNRNATTGLCTSCGTLSNGYYDYGCVPQCNSGYCWNGALCTAPTGALSSTCSALDSNAYCDGIANRTRSCVYGTGWSYSSWNYGSCVSPATQTVTGTDTETTTINCSAYNAQYCSGTMQRSHSRSTSRTDTYCGTTLTNTGTTTYGSYGAYTYGSTSGCTAYTYPTDTEEGFQVVDGATQSESQSCSSTCSALGYGCGSTASGTQTRTYYYTNYQSRDRNVYKTCCGTSCSITGYGDWSNWSTYYSVRNTGEYGACNYTTNPCYDPYCSYSTMACTSYSSSYCGGTATCTASCGGGTWNYSACLTPQSCTATSSACSSVSSSYCSGTATRSVTGTCGSCSYGSWNTSGCTATASCTDTSTTCSNISSSYCSGTATRSVTGSCGTCTYSSWNTSGCSTPQTCTDTSTTCSSVNSSYCSGTATRSVTGTCGSCTYGSWNTSGCTATASCTATSSACSSVSSSYCSGTATRSVTGSCGSCTYGSWNTGNCLVTQTCTQTTMSCGCSGYVSRSVTSSCGTCTYSAWDYSNCQEQYCENLYGEYLVESQYVDELGFPHTSGAFHCSEYGGSDQQGTAYCSPDCNGGSWDTSECAPGGPIWVLQYTGNTQKKCTSTKCTSLGIAEGVSCDTPYKNRGCYMPGSGTSCTYHYYSCY